MVHPSSTIFLTLCIGACLLCGCGEPSSMGGNEQRIVGLHYNSYSDDGQKEWTLNAEEALVQQKQELVITRPQILVFNEDPPLELNAEKGFSNREVTHIRLSENVVMKRSAGSRILTDQLVYETESQKIYTDAAWQLMDRNVVASGEGMVGNQGTGQYTFKKSGEWVLGASRSESKGGVRVRCDPQAGLVTFDMRANKVVFEHGVVMTLDQARVETERLVVSMDPNSSGKEIISLERVQSALAVGNVRIVDRGFRAKGDQAHYNPTDGGVFTVTGKPAEAVDGRHAVKSPVIIYKMATGEVETGPGMVKPLERGTR